MIRSRLHPELQDLLTNGPTDPAAERGLGACPAPLIHEELTPGLGHHGHMFERLTQIVARQSPGGYR